MYWVISPINTMQYKCTLNVLILLFPCQLTFLTFLENEMDKFKAILLTINLLLVGTELLEELNYRMSRYFSHFKYGFANLAYSVVLCVKN